MKTQLKAVRDDDVPRISTSGRSTDRRSRPSRRTSQRIAGIATGQKERRWLPSRTAPALPRLPELPPSETRGLSAGQTTGPLADRPGTGQTADCHLGAPQNVIRGRIAFAVRGTIVLVIHAPGENQMRMPVDRRRSFVEFVRVKGGDVPRQRIQPFDLGPFELVDMDPGNRRVPQRQHHHDAQHPARRRLHGPDDRSRDTKCRRHELLSTRQTGILSFNHTPDFNGRSTGFACKPIYAPRV